MTSERNARASRSFWIGGHKAGKTSTQRSEVDAEVAAGVHVHTFGEEGARCYNGGCDLTVPLIGRSTGPIDSDNLPTVGKGSYSQEREQ